MAKLLQGAIISGIVIFVWTAVSWLALPWHNRVIHPFEHDSDILQMIDFGAGSLSGIYCAPASSLKGMKGDTALAFVAYSKEGAKPAGTAMGLGFLMNLVGGFIISCLLSKTTGLAYAQKILFVALFGLAVGLLGYGPNWIWWGFGTSYTLVSIADSVIGWTLAGLALGKVV